MSEPNWAWWQNATKGVFGPIHEGQAEQGFYRVRNGRGGPWVPVALWVDEKTKGWRGLKGDKPLTEQQVGEIWGWCCRNPITHEVYKTVRAGGAWPDQIDHLVEKEAAKIAPPADEEAAPATNAAPAHEVLLEEIAALDRAFEAWLASIGGKVASEEHDAAGEQWRLKFLGLKQKGELGHKTEKAPVLAESKRIDAAWKTPIGEAQAGQTKVSLVLQTYRLERKARQDAEIARQRAAAEEAARKVAEVTGTPVQEVKIAAPRAAPRTGLVTRKVVVVDDLAKLCAFILKHDPTCPTLLAPARVLANKMIGDGIDVDGVHVDEETGVR